MQNQPILVATNDDVENHPLVVAARSLVSTFHQLDLMARGVGGGALMGCPAAVSVVDEISNLRDRMDNRLLTVTKSLELMDSNLAVDALSAIRTQLQAQANCPNPDCADREDARKELEALDGK